MVGGSGVKRIKRARALLRLVRRCLRYEGAWLPAWRARLRAESPLVGEKGFCPQCNFPLHEVSTPLKDLAGEPLPEQGRLLFYRCVKCQRFQVGEPN